MENKLIKTQGKTKLSNEYRKQSYQNSIIKGMSSLNRHDNKTTETACDNSKEKCHICLFDIDVVTNELIRCDTTNSQKGCTK